MFTTKQKKLLKRIDITFYDENDINVAVNVYDDKTHRWYWLDFALENDDIIGDWNQYIFFTDNDDDNIRCKRQDEVDAYEVLENLGRIVLLDLDFIRYRNNGGDEWNIDRINEAMEYIDNSKKKIKQKSLVSL